MTVEMNLLIALIMGVVLAGLELYFVHREG